VFCEAEQGEGSERRCGEAAGGAGGGAGERHGGEGHGGAQQPGGDSGREGRDCGRRWDRCPCGSH